MRYCVCERVCVCVCVRYCVCDSGWVGCDKGVCSLGGVGVVCNSVWWCNMCVTACSGVVCVCVCGDGW